MKMASDSSLGMVFREQARIFARSLFISPDEALKVEDSVIPGANLFPDTIRIFKNLTRINDSLFTGSLTCRRIKADSAENSPVIPWRIIPFCVARTNRIFGTDTVRHWNAFLGGISWYGGPPLRNKPGMQDNQQ